MELCSCVAVVLSSVRSRKEGRKNEFGGIIFCFFFFFLLF